MAELRRVVGPSGRLYFWVGVHDAEVMARAIVRAATEATGLPNLPAVRDLKKPR